MPRGSATTSAAAIVLAAAVGMMAAGSATAQTFKLPKEDFGRFEPIGKAAPSNAPKPPASQGQQTPPTRDNNNGGGNGQPETPRTRETRLPDPPGPTFDPPGPGDGGGIVPNR